MKTLKGGRFSDVAPVLIGGLMVGGRIAMACSTDADCPALAKCPSIAGKCDGQGCLYMQCI